MADPLSIAASAATVVSMCKTICSYTIAFTIGLRTVPQVLEDFKTSISSLTSALRGVEDLFKNQPKKLPFAEKEESRHWRDIENVVAACHRSLIMLSDELPDLEAHRNRPLDELRKQLTLKLNSDTISDIRRRQTEYTHTLQLSLITLSLGGIWATQQSQEILLERTQHLTKEMRAMKHPDHRESIGQASNPGVSEDASPDCVEAWRGSAVSLANRVTVTLTDPNQPPAAAMQGSLGNANPSEDVEGSKLREVVYDDDASGCEIFDPEPDYCSKLKPEILQCQIEAAGEEINKSQAAGLHRQAEHYLRVWISLRDQLELAHDILFTDRQDAEETLADILMLQGAPRLVDARLILEELLKQETKEKRTEWDLGRVARLYHKLSAILIQNRNKPALIERAQDFANRALEYRSGLEPMDKELVVESAELLAMSHQLLSQFSQAKGVRDWIKKLSVTTNKPAAPSLATTESVQWCKQRGFDVDSTPGFRFDSPGNAGKTPLHIAVSEENLEVVKQMVDHVTTLETPDEDNRTALALSCMTLNYYVAAVLLDKGAKVDVLDSNHKTPLHLAQSMKGGVRVASLLLAHPSGPSIINRRDCNGYTALHLACGLGNVPMIQLLLENGSSLESRGPQRYTALHIAINSDNANRREAVSKLIELGADVTSMDAQGYNAAKIASQARYPDKKIQEMIKTATPQSRLTHRFSAPAPRRASGVSTYSFADSSSPYSANMDENIIPRKASNASSRTAPPPPTSPRRVSNPVTRPNTIEESPAQRFPVPPPPAPIRAETYSTVASTRASTVATTVLSPSSTMRTSLESDRPVLGPVETGRRSGKVMGILKSKLNRRSGSGDG